MRGGVCGKLTRSTVRTGKSARMRYGTGGSSRASAGTEVDLKSVDSAGKVDGQETLRGVCTERNERAQDDNLAVLNPEL